MCRLPINHPSGKFAGGKWNPMLQVTRLSLAAASFFRETRMLSQHLIFDMQFNIILFRALLPVRVFRLLWLNPWTSFNKVRFGGFRLGLLMGALAIMGMIITRMGIICIVCITGIVNIMGIVTSSCYTNDFRARGSPPNFASDLFDALYLSWHGLRRFRAKWEAHAINLRHNPHMVCTFFRFCLTAGSYRYLRHLRARYSI